MEGNGQIHAPAALPPGKEPTWYPRNEEQVCLQRRLCFWETRHLLTLSGIETRYLRRPTVASSPTPTGLFGLQGRKLNQNNPQIPGWGSRLHYRPKSLGSAELQWSVMQLLLGSHWRARGLWDQISRPFPSNYEVSLEPSFRRDHVF